MLLPGGKGGADALVQQVSGKQPVQSGGTLSQLVQRQSERLFLHGALRLFPGGLPKGIVAVNEIKGLSQRALPLQLSHYIGAGQKGGGMGESHGLLSQLFLAHRCHLATRMVLGFPEWEKLCSAPGKRKQGGV